MFRLLTISLVVLAASVRLHTAAAASEPPAGFRSLLVGDTLTGWGSCPDNADQRGKTSSKELATVPQSSDRQMRDHWRVVDGTVTFDGSGQRICTDRDFGDIEMLIDWKIEPGGSGEIWLRGKPAVRFWDASHGDLAVQGAAKGSGGLAHNKRYPRLPLVSADRPATEWNTFHIRIVGERVTVNLNDQLVTDNVVLENVDDRKNPIPAFGPIAISSNGFASFRNIYVRVLGGDNTKESGISPKDQPFILFNGKDLDGFRLYQPGTPVTDLDPAEGNKSFRVTDGMLHLAEPGEVGIITRRPYRTYHLVAEYKWGSRTWGDNAQHVRTSGLLIHCYGRPGSVADRWMSAVEVEMSEGATGDLLVHSGLDTQSGRRYRTTVNTRIAAGSADDPLWQSDGQPATLTDGRLRWFGKDPQWTNEKGFRGHNDLEQPIGEWNRLEIITNAGRLTCRLNGVTVSAAESVQPDFGRILLQVDNAELFIRRLELWPIGNAPDFSKE